MKKTQSKPTIRRDRDKLRKVPLGPQKQPFIKHVHELRKRLFYIVLFVAVFGGAAASIQKQLTAALLKPAGGQQFIYTNPGGGFDFAFKICLYVGIAASIPIIVYHLLKYAEPLVKKDTMIFVNRICFWSTLLAAGGICFGYFIALPPALHFLLQSFSTEQIKALISIQSYLSFVLTYLLGSAMLFQLPLILLMINKIHRLKPGQLLAKQRWVVLAAFIVGAIISPTPDIRNQAIMSGPIILTYNLSVFLIWLTNRKYHRPKKVIRLRDNDASVRATRLTKFQEARLSWQGAVQTSLDAPTTPSVSAVKSTGQKLIKSPSIGQGAARPAKYAQDFTRRPYRSIAVKQVVHAE